MKFKNLFSKRTVPSTTERHSTEPSSQSEGQYAGETPSSSSNAVSTNRTQAALADSSGRNQPIIIPQSINSGIPNDQVSTTDQPRKDPALDNTDKFLSALQAVSGMALPLGLPQAAKTASYLLSMLEDKKRNDAGVRNLIVDISKIILGLVKPLGKKEPTVTTEQEKVVADVRRYLETLQDLCEEYQKGKSISRLVFSSAWKGKIEDIRREVQTQLLLVNMTTILEVLNVLTSPPQTEPIATPHGRDQAFQEVEFDPGCDININNFTQSGLDQSRPIPQYQVSSEAFKRAKFAGKVNVNNHHKNFGQQAPW